MSKFYIEVFYVMEKVLSGKLSYMQTGLVMIYGNDGHLGYITWII